MIIFLDTQNNKNIINSYTQKKNYKIIIIFFQQKEAPRLKRNISISILFHNFHLKQKKKHPFILVVREPQRNNFKLPFSMPIETATWELKSY